MTNDILIRNGIDVPHVAAFLMNSRTPVTRLTARPTATALKTQRKADSGMFLVMPSRRKSSTKLAPTSTAMPIVWSVRTVALPQTDGDSRNHTASDRESSHSST
jgi:hypothetical protein